MLAVGIKCLDVVENHICKHNNAVCKLVITICKNRMFLTFGVALEILNLGWMAKALDNNIFMVKMLLNQPF